MSVERGVSLTIYISTYSSLCPNRVFASHGELVCCGLRLQQHGLFS